MNFYGTLLARALFSYLDPEFFIKRIAKTNPSKQNKKQYTPKRREAKAKKHYTKGHKTKEHMTTQVINHFD